MTAMKKTHWLRNTLIVLVICGLAGTVLAAILFSAESNRTYASASIQFSFESAASGKAPNGYPFNVSNITEDEVLEEALAASGLSGVYTAEQLRENLTVTGVYPQSFVEQMTKYVSLLEKGGGSQATRTEYHATQYSVTLYNDFDKGISQGKLKELLNNILDAYRVYFAKRFSPGINRAEVFDDPAEYDYVQQLEAVSLSVTRLQTYAGEIQALAQDFQQDGKGFGNILARYKNLSSDISQLNATVVMDAVSRNRDRLRKLYELEAGSLKNRINSLTEELKQIEAQMKVYEKDSIIYYGTESQVKKINDISTDTYDRLAANRKEATESIAKQNAELERYQSMLEDLENAAGQEADGETDGVTAAQLSGAIEQEIAVLTAKRDEITKDFEEMLAAYSEEKINEKTVSVTAAKYETPSLLSGAFIKRVLKTAGPICAIGFIVCIALLIRSRRKEEKA